MKNLFKKLFQASDIKSLTNKISHVAIEHKKAQKKIDKAQKLFDAIREHTVADFENLKKRTIEKTAKAMARINDEVMKESLEIDRKYSEAKAKVEVKAQSTNELNETLKALKIKEFKI